MKNKNILFIIGALLIGLLLGKIIFGNPQVSIKKDIHRGETAIEHWTCSMHPQIDMPEPGQCPICGMDLIPKNEKSQDKLPENSFTLSKKAMDMASVETIKIGADTDQVKNESLILTGRLVENKENLAIQVAHTGGRIEKMYIEAEGDLVKKGQKIALIYSPELVTAQYEFLQAMKIKEEQPALYKSVRNKLKNWKLGEKQINHIEKSKKVISNMPIYADYSGYITKMKANEGKHLKEGEALFEIVDLSNLWVMADVYEKDISQIHRGQKTIVLLNAYPEKRISAMIDYVEPRLDPITRTAQVRIVLNNREQIYKPGMLAEIKVIKNKINTKKGKIIIPKTAVLWTGKRSVVYIKRNSEKPLFEMRKIILGKTYGDKVEILAGLKPGDEIVVNGVFTIDASAQLQGKPSMMTSGGSKTGNKHSGMDM